MRTAERRCEVAVPSRRTCSVMGPMWRVSGGEWCFMSWTEGLGADMLGVRQGWGTKERPDVSLLGYCMEVGIEKTSWEG